MRRKASLACVCLLLSVLIPNVSAQQKASADPDLSQNDCRLPVTILGAVTAPHRFELRRRVRLRELIALAGGVTDRAKGTIQILHADLNPSCERISAIDNKTAFGGQNPQAFTETYNITDVLHSDEKANPYIRSGDTITVLEVGMVRVVGNVKNPQAILLKDEMTLMQAIKLAGGAQPDSRTSRVVITRAGGKNATTSQIEVNLKAIAQRRANDLTLLPNDIVYVPSKKGGIGCCSGQHVLIVDLTIDQLPLRVIE